jgi:hypothetical protein
VKRTRLRSLDRKQSQHHYKGVNVPDIDGVWAIEIATPMGTQKMNLHLATNGGELTGTSMGDAGELQIHDGTVAGATVDFIVDTTFPFAMALHFILSIDGDSLTGTSKAGAFPPSPVTGSRLAAAS